MRKFMLSFALAGLVATCAVAEESGTFVGVQGGYGAVKFKAGEFAITGNGFRYGAIAGYKQFFSPEFGVRYYGVFDNGTSSKKLDGGTAKFDTWNANANVDALYNCVSSDSLDLGAFAGLSLGYANHKFKEDGAEAINGVDLGVNFGFRTNIAKQHGIELYSRFSFLEQKKDITDDDGSKVTEKFSQPYAVGLRYTFSF